MADVVLAWWIEAQRWRADERGTTVVEYLMIVALLFAAVVLVATFGASLAGDTI
jgi:Flp pilus assembly pilin Flp